MNFWETQRPDFVNELGVKWYFDKSVTDYCNTETVRGAYLDGVSAYVAVLPNGYTSRVLIQHGEIVFETQNLEAMAVEIDKMKLIKVHGKKK